MNLYNYSGGRERTRTNRLPSDGLIYTRSLQQEPIYQEYVRAFQTLAKGNPEAETLLQFLQERRRKAVSMADGSMYAIEEGDPKYNFFSVVIDLRNSITGREGIDGFAGFNSEGPASYLRLKNARVTSEWKGAVFGHEGLHAYHYLTGIESRPDGFMLGEQEAYDFELRLLDGATQGKLSKALESIASAQPSDRPFLESLQRDDTRRLNELFRPVRSPAEDGARLGLFFVGANFKIIEKRAESEKEVTQKKVGFIRDVFEGRVRFGK